MQIKKFMAKNIQEALKQVKNELGPEALVISVKNKKINQGPLALLSPTMVEVTAARDEAPPVKPFSPPSRNSHYHLPDFKQVSQNAKQMTQTMKKALTSFRTIMNKPSQGPKAKDRVNSLADLLLSIGLQEDITNHIIEVLYQEMPNSEYSYDSFHLERLAKDLLQQLIKTSGPITLNERKPKFVALVGPTGTGKTTTIAKLSAESHLKRKKKVALITIDTYRIGAMEQLNAYAGIMNIPVKLVSTFEQMRKAMLQYQDQDLVFIDTAGFSHYDREHLQLLNAFLAQVSHPEIHLTVNVNTNEKELIQISQKFNALNYHSLLFTKLDESAYLGTIFNHMVYTGKPISYLTTGQKVPEDIELATPATITQRLFRKNSFYQAQKSYVGKEYARPGN